MGAVTMLVRGRWVAWGLSLILVIGCDDGPPPPSGRDAGPPDGGSDAGPPSDAGVCPDFAPGAFGAECASDDDRLVGGSVCIDERFGYRPEGYCTRPCDGDAQCGERGTCTHISSIIAEVTGEDAGVPALDRFCVPNCCAGSRCPTGQLCQDVFLGFAFLDAPGCVPADPLAEDGDPCEATHECNRNSICHRGINSPGGYCSTIGCAVDDDSTCAPGGARCVQPADFARAVCVAECVVDSDCRVEDGYRCESLVGICGHPLVGESCATPSDCGVEPWTCRSDSAGGHCTVPCADPTDDCGAQNLCHVPDGETPYCVRACDPAADDCPTDTACTAVLGGFGCLAPEPAIREFRGAARASLESRALR